MVKRGNITPEIIEILREIGKHPSGTAPGIIYKHFDSQTWDVLKARSNKDKNLSPGEVFQLLCKLVKDPHIFDKVEEKVEESEKRRQITLNSTSKIQKDLDHIIEYAIISFNDEIQRSVDDFTQKVLNEVKSKLNDSHNE